MSDQLNHQLFKMAAPGCGVIAFRDAANPGELEVILSQRAESVGAGLGITGGGFVECGDIYKEKVGFISLSADEAYRECVEENPGFENIISLEDFRERVQLVASFCVKAADVNGVHACTYFALRLTDEEWDKVMALPPSEERDGDLIAKKVHYTQGGLRMYGDADFYHPHETLALHEMLKLNGKNKLF